MGEDHPVEKKKKRLKCRILIISAAVLIVLVGAGGWFYSRASASKLSAQATAQINTTAVKRGSIRVSASGTGTLVSSVEANLSFPVAGVVGSLSAKVGDAVTAGQSLAQLKDVDQLQASVASAELQLLQAQNDLDALSKNKDVNLASAYKSWLTAQKTYEDAVSVQQHTEGTRCSKDMNLQLADRYKRVVEQLGKTGYGSDEWLKDQQAVDTAYANMTYCLTYSQNEITSARASVQVAETQLKQAEAKYNTLAAADGIDPDALALATQKVIQYKSLLTTAQKSLEQAALVSPINGTVTFIAAGQGEQVDTSTYITVADLSQPDIQVKVDEADLDKLVVGNKAEIVFDAFPDVTYTGSVVQVDPALTASGQYQVATGLIKMDVDEAHKSQTLPLGLNAAVDVISSEADNVLLVPLDALRSLGDGQYSVFVLVNGQLQMKVVEVGLKDSTSAEVKSGLQLGDRVSTGTLQVKS